LCTKYEFNLSRDYGSSLKNILYYGVGLTLPSITA
jgi:hypothetical protein